MTNFPKTPPRTSDTIPREHPSVAELAGREGYTEIQLLRREVETLKSMHATERRMRLKEERAELVEDVRRLRAALEKKSRRIGAIDAELKTTE